MISSKRLTYTIKDIANRIVHGKDSPRCAQLIWIDPQTIDHGIAHGFFSRRDTGRIVAGDWDRHVQHLETSEKIRHVKERMLEGRSWSEVGWHDAIIRLLQPGSKVDGCTTANDVSLRAERLDRLIDRLRTAREPGFKTRQELVKHSFREDGGILIHVGRRGGLFFGWGSHHRFAIAKYLGFTRVPAQLGVVHKEAVLDGVWKRHFQ